MQGATGHRATEMPMSLGAQIAWDDTVLPFQLDASDIRGRVARLDGTLERVLGAARLSARHRGAGGRGGAARRADRPDHQAALEALAPDPRRRAGAADRGGLLRPREPRASPRASAPGRASTPTARPRRRALRADRQGLLRHPDRPGRGHDALPGHHAPLRRVARRLRRDLLRPVRADPDPLRPGLRRARSLRGDAERGAPAA